MLPLVRQRYELLLPGLVRVEGDAAAGRIEQRLQEDGQNGGHQ